MQIKSVLPCLRETGEVQDQWDHKERKGMDTLDHRSVGGDKNFDKSNNVTKTSKIYTYFIFLQGLPGLPGLPGEIGPEGQGIPGPKVLVIMKFLL